MITNNKKNEQLSGRTILTVKNKDVDELNFVIQNQIVGSHHSSKSKPTKTMQWNALDNTRKYDSRDDNQRKIQR